MYHSFMPLSEETNIEEADRCWKKLTKSQKPKTGSVSIPSAYGLRNCFLELVLHQSA